MDPVSPGLEQVNSDFTESGSGHHDAYQLPIHGGVPSCQGHELPICGGNLRIVHEINKNYNSMRGVSRAILSPLK